MTSQSDAEQENAITGPAIKALSFIFAAAGKIPLNIRQAVGRWCGIIFTLLPTRERSVAITQLKTFLPEIDTTATVRKMFGNIGETFTESLNLSPILEENPSRIVADDPELFESLMKSERPVIALTAHTGNWELLGAYFNRRHQKVISIGRPARSATMHAVLKATRARAGINMMWRQGKGGLKELIEALRAGRLIGALVDQDTQVSSLAVPFFGTMAQTPVTLIELGKKYNALFYAVFIVREADKHFRFFITPIDESAANEEILRSYNASLEKFIRQYPDQWIWFHKRWRTLPSGERLSTANYIAFLEERITHGKN